MGEVLFSIAVVAAAMAIGAGLAVMGLSKRLRVTEQALVATLRLVESQSTALLPRELREFLAANPGGVHRG